MKFSKVVNSSIKPWHLLNHPFYKNWIDGNIEKETLKEYAIQYYKHVEAFPRYISATHSKCTDINSRRVLLENLNDEEGVRGKPHPELWMQFAQALGLFITEVESAKASKAIKSVIETFIKSSNGTFEEGLASFYSYEYQVPEIAESKTEGLRLHYDIRSEEGLEFFEVHKEADVYHRKACEELLDKIDEEMKDKAIVAAKKSAQALWCFLDEMQKLDLENKGRKSA